MLRGLLVLLAVCVVAGEVAEPNGKYCTTFDVIFLKETIELFVDSASKQFAFKAKGAMTIPPCIGNNYLSTADEEGNLSAKPDMNEPEACLMHELRHLGPEGMEEPPVEILWQKETDTVDVRITSIPIIGEVSFTLTRDGCEEEKPKKCGAGKKKDEEL